MRQRAVVYAHDVPGLAFAMARARRECQGCDGGAPAQVCGARVQHPPQGKQGLWYVAMLCGECIAKLRADPRLAVVAEVS